MSRLNDSTKRFLIREIYTPSYVYDPRDQKVGIVHFGIGAFHRAHQAWYTDAAMNAGDRDWAIVGVSLRSPKVMVQLNPQNGRYTVTERHSAGASTRLIGSIKEVLVADRHPNMIVDRIASSHCHIVSFTITEKGYCRKPDETLDFELAEQSFYPFLTDALARRKDEGLPGLTLLSCDNLSRNGQQLERLMTVYIEAKRPDLVDWFADKCACPSSMVDRIVPATTPIDLDAVQQALGGSRDEGAVITEPFSQWVIEDKFAGPRPRWEVGGAEFVSEVAPYETAKLRMLNGAHSLLAYLGLAHGHTFVHEAVADPAIRPLVESLMREEAAPTIAAAPGQDLMVYADALLARFANSALNHSLIQIAMDGSQKIPQRWLETLAWHQARGGRCPAILNGIAAWLLHIRGDARPVDDPLGEQFGALWETSGQDGILNAVLGPQGALPSAWEPDAVDQAAIQQALTDR